MMRELALNTTVLTASIFHDTGEVPFCQRDSLEIGPWYYALIDSSQAVLGCTLSAAFMFPAAAHGGEFPRPGAVRR